MKSISSGGGDGDAGKYDGDAGDDGESPASASSSTNLHFLPAIISTNSFCFLCVFFSAAAAEKFISFFFLLLVVV